MGRARSILISMRFIFVIVISILMGPWGSLWARPLIITVAQVRNHVITSREVDIHKAVDKALGVRSDLSNIDESLELLIREWLLYFESMSFYNNRVEPSAVDEALAQALSYLKKDGAWTALSMDQSELRKKIQRRLEADRLYLFKKKASVLPVTLAELEAEFTQNRVNYGAATFAEVREEIRKNKAQENLRQRLEQWFEILETKYRVQRFSKYSPQRS
jgi:hypothetical protein